MAQNAWFFLALVGPFLYALTNHIDKHLLEKYFQEDGVATLLLYSSLLSALALPFIFWADSGIFDVQNSHMLALAGVAILNVILLWAYFNALSGDDPTVVIIFYQLVPVLGLVFGFFILGETINFWQLAAMAIIILGTIVISFEIDDSNSFRVRGKTTIYMTIAVICWALEATIFKMVALEENVWRSLFWEHLALAGVGGGIFIFLPKYRQRFLHQFLQNSKAVLSLNVLNEGIYMIGNIVMAFAALLAPIALILLMNSFQPIFVLTIGVTLTVFFPKIATENVKRGSLVQKLIAILITGIGTYMLLSN